MKNMILELLGETPGGSIEDKINTNLKTINRLDNRRIELKREINVLEKNIDKLTEENYNLCSHPPDKVVDNGGPYGSICECGICGKLISVSC